MPTERRHRVAPIAAAIVALTVPNANLTTRGLELRTSCGGPKALWIHETLDVTVARTIGSGSNLLNSLERAHFAEIVPPCAF